MTSPVVTAVTAMIFFAASVAFFFSKEAPGRIVDNALKSVSTKELQLDIPERKVFYDAEFLNAFKQKLHSQRESGRSALEVYVSPMLLRLDVGFAITFSIAIVLFWICIIQIAGNIRYVHSAGVFFAAMGVLYGVTDVAEDLLLATLLSKPTNVSNREALAARTLTQAKIGSVVLSLTGGVVFVALRQIARTIDPVPTERQ